MPTQYVTRCSCKKGCTKVCGCKPEHCTKYCKCQGCDYKKNIRRYTVQNVSFMRKLRIVEMNIFIYRILYFDVIMKKSVSPVTISHCFLPCNSWCIK